MSFGYSAGDFVLLTQLAWQVVQNSRKACGAHDELTSEVTSLHIVLRRLEVEVSKPNSILNRIDGGVDRKEELAQLSSDCRRVLRVMDRILEKYNALSEEKRSVTRLWKKVQFGNGEMLDLAEIRLKISTSTSALTLFLNLLSIGSQGKVESYMESQGDELREMRRSLNWITASMQAKAPKAGEGSILTTYAGDDKAIWKDFRRELIKEGFSSDVLRRHKETIKEYVMELGNLGALDDVKFDDTAENLNTSIDDHGGAELPVETVTDDVVEEDYMTEPEQESDKETKDEEKKQQSNAKCRHLESSARSSDEEASWNGTEPESVDSPHNNVDITTAAEKELVNDEMISSKLTDRTIESQSNELSTPLHEVENNGETQTSARLTVAGKTESQIKPIQGNRVTSEMLNLCQDEPLGSCSDDDVWAPPEDLLFVLPMWFGPYRPRDSHYGGIPYSKCWGDMEVQLRDMIVGNKPVTEFDPFTKCLLPLCNWILAATRIYDKTKVSAGSTSNPPKPISALAIEVRSLLFRACAYNARIRISLPRVILKQRLYEFKLRFSELMSAFSEFIEDSILYMLVLVEERKQGLPLQAQFQWTLWDDLSSPEKVGATQEVFTDLRAFDITQIKNLWFPRAGDDNSYLLYALFEDDDSTISKHAFVRKSTLADFVPKVQALLLFFKRYCEDAILREEWPRRQRWPYEKLEYSIGVDERNDPIVVQAVLRLHRSNQALETWSTINTYPNDMIKIKPFSRKTDSLSAILLSCDSAQNELYLVRTRRVGASRSCIARS
jgi:hypothetical protein